MLFRNAVGNDVPMQVTMKNWQNLRRGRGATEFWNSLLA